MDFKTRASLLMIVLGGFALYGFKGCESKSFKSTFDKFIANQNLSEDEKNIIRANHEEVMKKFEGDKLVYPENEEAYGIVESYEAKVLSEMKKNGDINLCDEESSKKIKEAIDNATNKVKEAEYTDYTKKGCGGMFKSLDGEASAKSLDIDIFEK